MRLKTREDRRRTKLMWRDLIEDQNPWNWTGSYPAARWDTRLFTRTRLTRGPIIKGKFQIVRHSTIGIGQNFPTPSVRRRKGRSLWAFEDEFYTGPNKCDHFFRTQFKLIQTHAGNARGKNVLLNHHFDPHYVAPITITDSPRCRS